MALRAYAIPTPDGDSPISTQRTTLSGQTYRLDFRYNTRRELWELSLYDEAGTPVAEGLAIVANWDLLYSVASENRPPGGIFLYTGSGVPATLQDLVDEKLYYIVDDEAEGEV